MKEIISITMGTAADNKDEVFNLMGEEIRLKQLGADFNVKLIRHLLQKYSGEVDVITVTGLPTPVNVSGRDIYHPLLEEFTDLAHPTPLMDGTHFRNLLMPWALHRYVKNDPTFLKNKKVGIFVGTLQKNLISEFKAFEAEVLMADLYFALKVPKLIKTANQLENLLKVMLPIANKTSLKNFRKNDFSKPFLKKIPGFKEFFSADIFLINERQLDFLILPDLKGKDVIIDYLTPRAKEVLRSKNVKNIYPCLNALGDSAFQGFCNLESMLQAIKEDNAPITENEAIEFIDKLGLKPDALKVDKSDQKATNRFAFIIHPLTKDQIFNAPFLRPLKELQFIQKFTERAVTLLPGFHYGQIKGIKSQADNTEVIGDIYAVTETPKMMVTRNKQAVYDKLINITKDADKRRNQIIGLGAYTKIVGDAGVTINKYSPIPVTTGNSLSAAATLWAASYAIDRIKFVKKENDIYNGTVMIVGATGSIGKVNSKVLCQSWKRVIVVAPKPYKIIDLKDELLTINPNCDVVYSTDPNKYTHECDLIITTTSARGKKILDIEKVKPGCVICDVSRPFDISEEDARSRPDVLVIASGEVELPGEVSFQIDIGLSGNTVYACLAETALLAMEGRFESFSLSRDISYQKVFEIDRLSRKHGVRLSAIMGHRSEITDEEMELCRQHALKKLQA